MPHSCDDTTLVPTPEGDGVILLACKPNEGVFHKLSWNSVDELEWTTMQQTMKYPRHWTAAIYIPDELTNCYTGKLLLRVQLLVFNQKYFRANQILIKT